MGLNQRHKDKIESFITPLIARVQDRLVTKSKEHYLTALTCILPTQVSMNLQAKLEEWGVWDDIKELRWIFVHEAPQNAPVNVENGERLVVVQVARDDEFGMISPLSGASEGEVDEFVMDVDASETATEGGILSLVELDDNEHHADRDDVVTYINDRLAKLIYNLEHAGVYAIEFEEDKLSIDLKARLPERLVETPIIAALDGMVTACQFMEVPLDVQRIILQNTNAAKHYMGCGMSWDDLCGLIDQRILKESAIKSIFLADDAIKWCGLFFEMDEVKYKAVLAVMKNRYANAFFKLNPYLFGRFEGLSSLQWQRLGILLATNYAAEFITNHIYLTESILNGGDAQFEKIKSVFSVAYAIGYVKKLFHKPGFHRKVKGDAVGHLFRVAASVTARTFFINHEVLLMRVVVMSEKTVMQLISCLERDLKFRQYLGDHPDKLVEESDLAIVIFDASQASKKSIEMTVIPSCGET